MSRLRCNFHGKCELYASGYATMDECKQKCTALENESAIEVAYTAISYDPVLAVQLAPSDQVAYIRREYGVTVRKHEARSVLDFLLTDNYYELYLLPAFQPYVQKSAHPFQYLMLQVIADLLGGRKPPVLLTPTWEREWIAIYRVLANNFNEDYDSQLAQELRDNPPLNELALREMITDNVAATLKFRLYQRELYSNEDDLIPLAAKYLDEFFALVNGGEIPYLSLI